MYWISSKPIQRAGIFKRIQSEEKTYGVHFFFRWVVQTAIAIRPRALPAHSLHSTESSVNRHSTWETAILYPSSLYSYPPPSSTFTIYTQTLSLQVFLPTRKEQGNTHHSPGHLISIGKLPVPGDSTGSFLTPFSSEPYPLALLLPIAVLPSDISPSSSSSSSSIVLTSSSKAKQTNRRRLCRRWVRSHHHHHS